MKLLRIHFKNIGPYGNKIQTIELDDKGGVWMILGKNGVGKSFLSNLPKILYYGKLDKFKKEDIANRLNHHGWIKGEIQVNPKKIITIERKIAPSDLLVEKNKKDIGKSGITNYQDYIDTEVIGLPYHIFSNIISLSVNEFKSFVSMTPNDKRIIIDKLFAMEIINRMNDLVRKDLRDSKIDMDMCDREITSLKKSILIAQKEFQKLKEKIKEDSTKKIQKAVKKMLEYKPRLEKAEKRIIIYREKEADIKRSYNIFHRQKAEIEAAIVELNKKEKLYNQDKCPTCETPFTDKRFELIRGELEKDIKYKKEELKNIVNTENKYTNAFQKIHEAIKKLNDFIIQVRSAYTILYNELQKLQKDKPKELESIKNIISKNTIVIQKKERNKIEVDNEVKYLSILEELYSDSGVKKKILESYLPTLNREVEYTLEELHFPYILRFDNDFEPHLQHLGIDINVETLSTGEKKKVDLAVLISIIRMLKRKYPSLNIFMLDEVLSSIDGDGIYDIIDLLKRTSKEMSINIFIINHSPLPIEYFDYKINITKKDGFSDLNIEKLNMN